MNTLTRCAGPARFLLLSFAAILLPMSAGAQQPVLSVSQTSVSAQANAGANAPSQSVRLSNAENGALKWSVLQGANWVTVSPDSGVNSGNLTLTFQTSDLPAGQYNTSFRVESNGGAVDVGVQVTIASGSGSGSESGGAPVPPPPPPPAPPPSSGYGPQSTITCPAGAVDIWPGVSIQTMVDSYPGSTTFCIRAGTHSLRSSITPKTGDTFVGEYGAVLDGTGWTTSESTQAAFRAHNQDIDYVTIRNLVIRNMPQRGIHAYYWMSDHWTVEYTEIAASANTGIVIPPYSLIRNNYIHHNPYAGYMGPYAHNSTFDSNEIAYNGWEQKLGETANVTFRNNFVHHNVGIGIWYDSNNTGALIEGNRVEDNGHIGIFYEISSDAIIRNNTIRRNSEAGIMLSVSKNVQIYNNTLEHNFRGITYFLNCPSVGGSTNFDLTNNTAHDNAITVGTQSGAFASVFSYGSSCTSTQVAPYLNGSKNLTFSHNTYRMPSLTGRYWVWGTQLRSWIEWQALGQDATGTASQ